MKRPLKVKILGKPYEIRYVAEDDSSLEGNNALCIPDEQLIIMTDGLPRETEQDYLWHEIKHAVEAAMGLDLEDIVIQKLATGEIAVIKDNPSLITYLRSKK